MAEEHDDLTAKVDQALSESQRQEREERKDDMARQLQVDDALAETLAKRQAGQGDGTPRK